MKAIETAYKGYRFRSRTEARWAVFFDALDIAWEYEKEGFNLSIVGHYLPDFWLPQVNMWAEVKGKDFAPDELVKCLILAKETGYPCLMLNGQPDYLNYWAFLPDTSYCDYVLFDCKYYWETEGRFYSSTGEPAFQQKNYFELLDPAIPDPIALARGARFEYGERG